MYFKMSGKCKQNTICITKGVSDRFNNRQPYHSVEFWFTS